MKSRQFESRCRLLRPEGFWISIGNTVFAVVVNVFSPVQSKNFVKVKIMFSRIIILKKKKKS